MKIELGTANFIISGLQGNDEQKKEIAFRRLHDELWKSLCRRLRMVERCDEELSKEITQETFVNIYKAATEKNLPKPEALYSWILVISKRIMIDKWRSREVDQSKEMREVKDKINTALKKIESEYAEATKSGNQELIDATLEEYILIKEKADAINGLPGTFSFDEAFSEYSSTYADENELTGKMNFTYQQDEGKDSIEVKDEFLTNYSLREKMHDCIMDALKRLRKVSAERAEVLRLDFEEMSTLEISKIIDRTELATRKFLSESRKAFRKYAEPCRAYEIN